jgi:hypothetical protein
MNAEQLRLEQARTMRAPWKKWGPYLSERQWGTVREDYSSTVSAGTSQARLPVGRIVPVRRRLFHVPRRVGRPMSAMCTSVIQIRSGE